jgi:hypothetical protein
VGALTDVFQFTSNTRREKAAHNPQQSKNLQASQNRQFQSGRFDILTNTPGATHLF